VDCCAAKVTQTACQSSQAISSSIEYMVVDACNPSWKITQVDVALVIHFFCYAASFSELQAMCNTLSRNMKKGALIISYSCAALPRTPCAVDHFCGICGVADMQYLHGSVDPPTPNISEYLWAGMRLKTQNWPVDVIQKALQRLVSAILCGIRVLWTVHTLENLIFSVSRRSPTIASSPQQSLSDDSLATTQQVLCVFFFLLENDAWHLWSDHLFLCPHCFAAAEAGTCRDFCRTGSCSDPT